MTQNPNSLVTPNRLSTGDWLTRVALVGTAALAGVVGYKNFAERSVQIAGHDKVYVAKPGDTEWTIAERAFPSLDPREVLSYLDQQLPKDNQKYHTVSTGERFYFSQQADIGKETQVKGGTG